MNIAPWVPAALELGGLVASGVGSWLDSRDRRGYQNQIGQMQEDARKRVADAERIAIQRANRLSLLTKQNVRPEPIDVDLPVVPQYKPGTSTKIFKGLGFGLGAASLASTATQKTQEYNKKLAEKAGEQQAATDLMGVLAQQPKIGSTQLYESDRAGSLFENFFSDVDMINSMGDLSPKEHKIARNYLTDQYQQPAWTSGEVLTRTLEDVRGLGAAKALDNLKDNPDNTIQFDGLFSGDSESAFLGSYSKAIAGSYDAFKQQEVAQLNAEAALELKRNQMQAKRVADLLASKHKNLENRLKSEDNTQEYLERGEYVLQHHQPFQGALKKYGQLTTALNLIQQSVEGPWITELDKNGNPIIDPITNKPRIIENKHHSHVIDKTTGELTGLKLTGGTVDALYQFYQRGMDDGVVHGEDVVRIRSAFDTWWQTNIGQPFESWYNRNWDPEKGVGTKGGSPQPVSPTALFELAGILDENKILMQTRIDEHLTNTINAFMSESVLQNIRDGGIYDWQNKEQFQRDLTRRLALPYQSYLDPNKFSLPRRRSDLPLYDSWQQQIDTYNAQGADINTFIRGAIDIKNAQTSLTEPLYKEDDPDTMIGDSARNYWAENLFKNPNAEPLPGAFLGPMAQYVTDPSGIARDLWNAPEDLRRQSGLEGMFQLRSSGGGLGNLLSRTAETAAAIPVTAGRQMISGAQALPGLAQELHGGAANLAQQGLSGLGRLGRHRITSDAFAGGR